jgi:hypothetical protein
MSRKLADLAPTIDDVPGRVDGEYCVLRYGLPPVPAICVVAAKGSFNNDALVPVLLEYYLALRTLINDNNLNDTPGTRYCLPI